MLEFKKLKVLEWRYDFFEEKLFDSINKKPINKFPFFSHIDKNLYPYGIINKKKNPIVFLMKSQKEAGIIEPVIVAYILDMTTTKVHDSLEVYKKYQWESYYYKNFEITKDSIFIVHELEEYNPYYGDPNNVDSMNVLKTELKSTKYIINHSTNKFDIVK